jgi:integrase
MKSGARTIKHIYFVSLDIYLHSSIQEPLRASVPQLDLNLHSNPYDDKLISVFLEGGKRTLSKPIIKKDPITPDILNKIIDMYGKDHSNLKSVRLCAMLLLGYAGFLRYSEIANLKMENIKFFPSYIVVTLSYRNSAKEMYLKSQETGHALPLVLAITTLFPHLYTSVFPDTMFTTI